MSKQVNVKAYPKDFKEQVVKLAQVGDRSATQIAREFEISRESVRRWVKQAELDQGSRTDGLRSNGVVLFSWTPKIAWIGRGCSLERRG